MRIATIYDIHGNLPALEAVLRDIETEAPDLIVVGGDVAAGPMPGETIERLRALPAPARFIRGNADREIVSCYAGTATAELPQSVQEIVEWVTAQISRQQRDFLASFEPPLILPAAGLGDVLFCHATPRSDEEVITERTPDARVREILGGVAQPLIVCGHTHMQYDRRIGEQRLVNAGSVGMPYGEPGAYWLLLDQEVHLRRTTFDLDAAAARIRSGAYPWAADFAAHNILQPPTKLEALDVFDAWPPP